MSENKKHWHVASGLAGYGPDGSDGFDTVPDPESLADSIRDHLTTWSESEMESAESHAGSGDYKSAWMLYKHSETLDHLAANLDNNRANAPLYVNNREAWHATILRIVEDHFPLPVNEGRMNVYVWQCSTTDCDH